MDPLFQAFSPSPSVPLESKLQTYLSSYQSSGLDDPSSFFLDHSSTTNHDSTSISTILNDTPRKQSSVPEFITPVVTPNRMTHSLSTPSFSQFPMTGTQLMNAQFGNLAIDSSNNRLGSQVSSSRGSPQQSPLLSKRSRSPSKMNFLRSHNTSTPSPSHDAYIPPSTLFQESVGGTTYFYPQEENSNSEALPLVMPNISAFPGNPSHVEHMRPKDNAPSFFLPDELRMDILHRHQLTMADVNPEQCPDLPSEVDAYHKLCPLEPASSDSSPSKSSVFSYVTSVYKAINSKTGVHYCLRRIHGFRVSNTKCMSIIDTWKKIQHSNLVNLREVFTTKEFGDNSLIFVYDYHAGADTLMNMYFNNQQTTLNGYLPAFSSAGDGFHHNASKSSMSALRQHAGLLPESLIWAYIVQLSSVLRSIHAAGLACRAFEPSKILITGKSRLRLNCCGVLDILTFDASQPNAKQVASHFQQEDLVAFGRIVLALACNSLTAVQRPNLQSSLELIARSYSPDLRNLILYLANGSRPRSINDIMPMIGARFYTQLDAAQLRSDVIENELAKEVENGRLFRMLSKLGTIVERPEFNMDPSWSETGDRYLLKLFRDHLFHQVQEDGRPWVDASHIIQSLNKLDSGINEKVCLVSRDEQNVLVVTYAELKSCLESSLNEIMTSASGSKLNAGT